MKTYWNALGRRARVGLAVGAGAILVATVALGYWAMRDRHLLLADDLTGERIEQATRVLDAAKIPYRIGADGASIEVPESQMGRARVGLAGASVGIAPNLGLELFNNSDFAATDFTQRVNYQRALQGELTRTITAMDGVRAARVHLVLPDPSPLRKHATRPSAAVALAANPGHDLDAARVRGIQRLVASAVPGVGAEEVAIVDFGGRLLSRTADGGNEDLTSGPVAIKRDADAYLETKLKRLLADALPAGSFSVSVDAVLDLDRVKITTEQPLASKVRGDGEREVGVAIRERQSLRSGAGGDQNVSEVTDSEYEYRVGHRLEETLQAPGSIRRLSVAVLVHGAPDGLLPEIERLVAHAVGAQSTRGDAIAVIALPAGGVAEPVSTGGETAIRPPPVSRTASDRATAFALYEMWIVIPVALAALVAFLWMGRARRAQPKPLSDAEVDALSATLADWLRKDAPTGAGDVRG
ncbi:flagellar basal-body MS-ring/collar protein FliF [Niveibacterium sp. COAC-50]|uniref:flagellar basal-body MS-ring/collar protein FliF n=1 Tax=Niveibacterium sp. COAC-50 TaxID=2729384 RepID=UPI001554248C|nr:flagellar basal-body MS-ring/collar protein FliF [Niveibacterium sp. COAC-50]